MKQLKLKQGVKDFLGVLLLYLIALLGIVLLDARMAEINAQKNTTQQIVEVASQNKKWMTIYIISII